MDGRKEDRRGVFRDVDADFDSIRETISPTENARLSPAVAYRLPGLDDLKASDVIPGPLPESLGPRN